MLDRGLCLFFPGPNSFTGEDCAEFHLHGGKAVVAAALDALYALDGIVLAEPGAFMRRAFHNGKLDLLDAEATADLLGAETEAQRRFAAANASGRNTQLYSKWRTALVRARALIEAELDFADEADIPGSVSDQVWTDIAALCEQIDGHIAGYHRAEIARDGYDVVLVGPPNAGKSTLFNALARRDVAIVSDEAGTTRDLIEIALDLDGVKVRLTDSAGVRDAAGKVERLGIERTLARAAEADLVLWLQDASQNGDADRPAFGAEALTRNQARSARSAAGGGEVRSFDLGGHGFRT